MTRRRVVGEQRVADERSGDEGAAVGRLRAATSEGLRRPVLPTTAGAGADVGFSVRETVIGRVLLADGPGGALVASTFVPDDAALERALRRLAAGVSPRVVEAPGRTARAADELEEYLAGQRRSFDVPVDLALATPFQRSVLGRLAAVGYGRRTTYGALARDLGRASASRAVGAALGANPVCVVLPCHRVVAGSGALTGYAGGLDAKRRLLELEGAAPDAG
ncbi:methylated-DNA--[protein]-cysteine S-methyltransferase [uncultured Pseudokineococcus sp.]|uniref:methylated-DNA--[protein]-cysteine S-methyltransferase n=1 Tax=uncultured Pseudokineococcus sp. TaxID=1642928 RepID=UPI002636784F|nr:methylated-DNA--[protein]-cysteine S-methyltransferase [uncultured Pseudokineococcus sp.]